MATLQDLIPITQELIGGIITKPRMTEKLLKRPPFRFLHDVISQINKETGFINGLYEDRELDSANLKEKPLKIEYLRKLIEFCNVCSGEQIEVKPQKIVAGLEPENTNVLLQAIGTIATNPKINHQAAVKRVVNPGAAAEEEKEEQPVAAEEEKAPEPEAKAEEPSRATERRRSSVSSTSSNVNTDVNIEGVDGNWETTVQLFDGIITRPNLTERLLGKPPFRFIHDIITNSMKSTPGLFEGLFEEHEMDSKQIKDKHGKLAFLNKLNEEVARQFNSNVPARPSRIVAGHEPEKTNKLLQMVALIAKGQVQGGNDTTSVQPSKAQEEEEEKQESPPMPQAPAPLQVSQKKKEESKEEEKEEPASESKMDDDTSSRKVARPATARKRPPKLKNNVQEIEMRPGGGDANTLAARPVGVMVEGEDDDSDDEVIDPVLMEDDMMGKNRGRSDSIVSDGGPKGKLVRDILDEEKQQKEGNGEVEESKAEQSTNLGKVGMSLRKGKASTAAYDIEDLRHGIQVLCKSTHPLGKCMDYVHEDVEIMNKEFEKWRAEFRTHYDALEDEQRETEDTLNPLKQKLREMEECTKDEASKINAIKAKIAKNETRIQEQMRRMVTG